MNDLGNLSINMVAGHSALAAGTTTTYTTANAFDFCINGKSGRKAAVTNGAAPTVDAVTGAAFVPQAIGTGSVYVYFVNAAGTVSVAQGQVVKLDVAGNFSILPQFPALPSGLVAFGYEVVRLAPATAPVPAVAAWTFGASNQSGVTGVTYSFTSVMVLPDRPQSA